jgi:TRAP-type C4-dicarboxylate transport system permease small subunit
MTRTPDPAPQDVSDLASEVDAASRATNLVPSDAGATRFGRAVNAVAEAAGVAVLATIVFLVLFNAIGRYAFRYTFIWGDEMVLSLLPWLGMLGMFLSVRRRQIIRIDFLASTASPPVKRILDLFASLFAAAVFLYLAVVSFEYLQLFGGDRTIYLKLHKGWFMSAMAIGPLLAAAAYLVLAYEDRSKRPTAP